MDSDFSVFDWQRMFLGDLSLWFLAEIAVRTVILYAFTFALVRIVGQRTVGQLALIDYLLIVALGAAVGDPMFYADVPLVHGMVVITVIVLMTRGFTGLIGRFDAVETFAEGRPERLVIDGRIDLGGLKKSALAREEFYERLRLLEVAQLGELRAAYLEQSGQISVFRYPEARHGLPVEPPEDISKGLSFPAGSRVRREAWYACELDGVVRFLGPGDEFPGCPCGGADWTIAAEPSPPAHPPGRGPGQTQKQRRKRFI